MPDSSDEFDALNDILARLRILSPEQRRRIVSTLSSLISISDPHEHKTQENAAEPLAPVPNIRSVPFSADLSISQNSFYFKNNQKPTLKGLHASDII